MNDLLTWLWGRLPLNRKMRGRLIWLLSPKFVVGVSGVLRDGEGRILLLRHTYRGNTPWGLPGGGLKPGESLEECLVREFREETGLHIEAVSMLSGAAHPERRLVDMIFSCRLLPGESLDSFQPSAEVSEARYFHLHELPDSIPPGQLRMIRIAMSQAQQHDD
jgi:ADP-ribose pyrophosphatase YjhB (NUDIX family)